MAEQVQAILDGMVAPLRDLEERKVFSPKEIQTIVERRRASEYALKRRQARKADFIEYIQKEIQLEQLRELRVKRLKREQPKGKPKGADDATTKFLGDKHIRSHIHLIWTRTIRKFRSDMAVYLLYADYLVETKNYNKLSLLYAQALQLFPRASGLWIRAASHEYFTAGNIQSARVLLQRGLRINGTAEDLWLQSFVLELHVVQKLQGREAILRGESEETIKNAGNDDNIDEDHPLALAKLVYDHAVTKISSNVAFRLEFLKQCDLFPATNALVEHIIQSITKDCGNQPDAWIAKAMYVGRKQELEDGTPASKRQRKEFDSESPSIIRHPALLILQEATRQLPTSDMYCRAMLYMKELAGFDKDLQSDAELLADDFISQASSSGLLSSDVVLTYLELVRPDNEERITRVIETFQKTSHKMTASIWVHLAMATNSVSDAVAIYERAVEETSMTHSDHLMLLVRLVNTKVQLSTTKCDEILRAQERILYLAPAFADVGSADETSLTIHVEDVMEALRRCLDFVWFVEGLGAARKAYSSVLFQAGIAKLYMRRAADQVKQYLDTALDIETKCQDVADRKRRMARLFSCAEELFAGTVIAKEYRNRSLEEKQNR
jgi:tetratricopeptide (TPR) repeat protein